MFIKPVLGMTMRQHRNAIVQCPVEFIQLRSEILKFFEFSRHASIHIVLLMWSLYKFNNKVLAWYANDFFEQGFQFRGKFPSIRPSQGGGGVRIFQKLFVYLFCAITLPACISGTKMNRSCAIFSSFRLSLE